MNSLLWTGQIILAAAFFYSGLYKSIFSEAELIKKGQTGVVGQPGWLIRLIGICELLGVAGIILPWGLHTMPFLTPFTACCFALVMILAAPIHYRLQEKRNVMTNLGLLTIALLVAWGRGAVMML